MRALVRIDSTQDDGAVADLLEDLFRTEGIECTIYPVPAAGRNVVASVGAGDGAQLQYNAHMDTVPVGDAAKWSVPPFDAVERDGQLFGRGASDCKGGLAAMAMAGVALTRAGVDLPGRLSVAAVTGETKGNLGTAHLVDCGLRPDCAVFGEYSEATKVAIAYRGVVWGRVRVHGRTTHPGRPVPGGDAIKGFLDHLAPALRSLDVAHESHPLVPDARLTITQIRAGHAVNAVADLCEATFDIRIVPGQESQEVWGRVRKLVRTTAERSGLDADVELIHALDPFETSQDHVLVRTLAAAIGEHHGGKVGMMGKAGMCDGNVLSERLGIPVVAYGPGNASGAGVDEYCDISALALALRTYIVFAHRWLNAERAPCQTQRSAA